MVLDNPIVLSEEIEALSDSIEILKHNFESDFNNIISYFYLEDTSTFPVVQDDGSYIINTSNGVFVLSETILNHIDTKELEVEGYQRIQTTNGSSIYYLYSENGYTFINMADSTQYKMELIDISSSRNRLGLIDLNFDNLKGCIDGFNTTVEGFKKLVNDIKSFRKFDDIYTQLGDLIYIMRTLQDHLECFYDNGYNTLEVGIARIFKDIIEHKLQKLYDNANFLEDFAVYEYHKYNKEILRYSQSGNLVKKKEAERLCKEALVNWTRAKGEKKLLEFFLDKAKLLEKITMSTINKLPKTLKAAKAMKAGKNVFGKVVKFIGTPVGTLLQAIPLYFDVDDAVTELGKWRELYTKVKLILPCPEDSNIAYNLFEDVKTSFGWHITGYGSVVLADAIGMVLDAGSISWSASLICDLYSVSIGWYNHVISDSNLKWYNAIYSNLKCNLRPSPTLPLLPPVNPIHDPSGYVYEAISSNRLQGVTATAYYKETVEDMYGDLHENVVLWDAAEYAQENPLFTDENGMYRWDVPQGLWQVKFEKEGYQTTYSEWLPVPPPQLDVNIPMTQMLQPTVISGKAYADGVEFAFDKYMDPATLNTDNIKVTKNGIAINGSIVLLNEEATSEGQQQTYASKVRFEVPQGEELLTTDKVQLTVRKTVKSYAGVQMENDFSQQFDVELHVRRIATDSLVNVAYGGQRTLKVGALPADAAKGKKMTVKTLSGMIATTNAEVLTLDENGEAELTINGELPGATAVTFAIEDTDVEAQMIVNVKNAANMVAVAPIASRISGTEVYRGTEIRLSTETENAVIYYTLDGSCPCDTKAAIRYNQDEPIVIATDNVVIKAIATAHDLGESEVKEFRYTLKKTTLSWQMPKGWTWISHNMDEAVPVTAFQTNAECIVGQDSEIDIAGGMNGNLTTLQSNQTFKLKVTEPTEYRLSGYEFNAAANPTQVEVGWNWIGYPLNQTMTLDEALSFSSPTDGDCIVGQDGFAEYVDGKWCGTLNFLVPGHGYLYKSAVRNELLFNTTFVSTASSRMKKNKKANSVWNADSHAYPDIMPLTACLYDNSMKADASDFLIAAFAGEECRGVSQNIDGRMMVSIFGDGDEQLSFKAIDLQTGIVYDIKEELTFEANNKGTWNVPYALTLGDVSTVTFANNYGDVNGDGVVDVADIASIISSMASIINAMVGTSDPQADVNGDGTVDVADIATIICIMAEQARLNESFEEEE